MSAVAAPVASCSLRSLLMPCFESFLADVRGGIDAPGGMGEMEELLSRDVREMQRAGLEHAAQAKADAGDSGRCPTCGGLLSRTSHGHKRTMRTRFGEPRCAVPEGRILEVPEIHETPDDCESAGAAILWVT